MRWDDMFLMPGRRGLTFVPVQALIEHLAFETPFSVVDILGTGKHRFLTEARLAAIWLAHSVAQLGPSTIGRIFGRRRPREIAKLIVRADALHAADPDFRALTETVGRAIETLAWEHDA